jgi:hypothetical protein
MLFLSSTCMYAPHSSSSGAKSSGKWTFRYYIHYLLLGRIADTCQGIIMFLQSLPTQDWGDHEIEMLLSEAFVLNSIWQNAQSHFNAK